MAKCTGKKIVVTTTPAAFTLVLTAEEALALQTYIADEKWPRDNAESRMLLDGIFDVVLDARVALIKGE